MKHLILEDSVFLWNKPGRALFYDSTSFKYVLVDKETQQVKEFCDRLASPHSLHSIDLDAAKLDVETDKLLKLLLNKKMARYSNDAEDCSIPPLLLLNGDLDYMSMENSKDYINSKNLFDYLTQFTFYIEKGKDLFKKERERLISEIQGMNPSFEFEIVPMDINDNKIEIFPCYPKLNEKVILDTCVDKRRIYIHQKINVNYWGHLYAFPNGEIHPCPTRDTKSLLGWIWDPIQPIIAKELFENYAWRGVRDFSPCSECVFQWLCPSPKIIEREQGIAHICEVW